MRKIILPVFLILIFASPAFPADKPKVKLVENYMAVFDLETKGKVDKDVASQLTDSIRLEVVKTKKYTVIDRGNMDKILREQKFQGSGCVSGECIVEAGQLLGVGKIVTGSVGMMGKTYYLTLSIVNVETGELEVFSEDECKCEVDDLIKASKRLVKRLFGEQVVESQPASAKPESTEGQPYKDHITGMEFVFVKGGCFQMGDTFGDRGSDKKPVHEVCVNDFYIGRYEVTQKQWVEIMGNNPSNFKNCDNCPVEKVSWDDIQGFISRLNQKTGGRYRLPTEAEWEYSARSGGKSEKWAGTSSESELGDYAWYDSNSGGKTHPVGQKKPNGLGIYDMSGNVWEWVNDWYDGDYYKNSPRNDPKGPSSGSFRVLRGGSWYYLVARFSRAVDRSRGNPGSWGRDLGLRLVRTP